ncbi:PAS domain-containing sensor histidine kinase [uncultured Pontibacter sp.]|uniref:PAS domain-containing sensor histidine kinase n=1 Tax=uncultured Pontibacter sp. TaxID=453356 RepID=UPI0026037518|nr:PAS domain-containing sensor histidine kinase [uncultured Pontibacter sp.]
MTKHASLSSELLRFLDAVPDLYLILSTDLSILGASKTYLEATQLKLEAALGRYLFEVLPDNPNLSEPDGTMNLRLSLQWVIQNKKPHQMALQRYDVQSPPETGNFQKRYWLPTNTPVLDENGGIEYILHKVVDVTEQVLAQEGLEKSKHQVETLYGLQQITKEELAAVQAQQASFHQQEEIHAAEYAGYLELSKAAIEIQRNRLHAVFMNSLIPFLVLDGPELKFQLFNPAFQRAFPTKNVLGKPFVEAFPELAGTPLIRSIEQVYRTGETYQESEYPVSLSRHGDGTLEELYFTFTYQARRNEQGEIDGLLLFFYEVTDHVMSRKKVEQSAETLRLITDALPVLIGYLDKEEKYRFTNKAYESWFPLKANELLGRPVRDVIGEKAYSGVKQYIDRALAGERLNYESRMPYREDFVKYIYSSYVPDIRDGEVVGFYTLVHDITEQTIARMKLEESEQEARALTEKLAATNLELSDTNTQLVRINADLDNFIYAASHDLKAPIFNIERLLLILLESIPSEVRTSDEVKGVIEMIESSIARFKRTIEHLTDVTKLQKENSQEVSEVNLRELIDDVALDLSSQIEKAGAKLEIDVAPHMAIRFSEKNMRSIVYNLLSNAIKYSSPDRVPLVQISGKTSGDFAIITVQDNGLGMSPSGQQKIFSMFTRLHDHVDGSGIGLYMVKRIVENAEGRIEVKSKVGKGSTLSIYLKR